MRKSTLLVIFVSLLLLFFAGRSWLFPGPALHTSEADTSGAVSFQIDVWADNWFAAYLGEVLLVEDSVPLSTERSFNAETVTFNAEYPLHLNFVLKDFKENDTGLEYIGTMRQQMGDGGFIMQLTDLNRGIVVAVTDETWACAVINTAPLDPSCADLKEPKAGVAPCTFRDSPEPSGWKRPEFNATGWNATSVHSADQVSPKVGYPEVQWDPSARFIWGAD